MEYKIICAVSLSLTLSLVGCSHLPAHITKDDTKHINISRPLIFSKESLILEREREIDWLEAKLNGPIIHGIQGKRFTREFSSLTGSVAVQTDPTQIDKYKAQQELDLENIERASQLSEQQQFTQIELEKANTEIAKKQQTAYLGYLDSVNSGIEQRQRLLNEKEKESRKLVELACAENELTGTEKTEATEKCAEATKSHIAAINELNSIIPSSENLGALLKPGASEPIGFETIEVDGKKVTKPVYGQDLGLPKLNENIENTLRQVESTATALDAVKDAFAVTANESNADGLSVTAIDDFEDDLAFRARVRDQIARTQLDERHDTFGNSLYRLQYNIRVLPENNNANWAKVMVTARPNSTTLFPEGVYKNVFTLAKLEQESRTESYKVNFKELSKLDKKAIPTLTGAHELARIRNYYNGQKLNLPRSIKTWSNQWLSVIRGIIQHEYTRIQSELTKFEADTDLYLHADRKVGIICYRVKDNDGTSSKETRKLLKNACRKNSNNIFELWNTTTKTSSNNIVSSDIYPIRALSQLKDAYYLSRDSKKNENEDGSVEPERAPTHIEKTLLHEVVLDMAVENVSRDYDFRQYVDVNSSYLDQENSANRDYIETIFLTWKKGKLATKVVNASTCKVTTQNKCQKTPTIESFNYGLWKLVSDLLTKQVSDVYSVTPIESTQRVEDIAEVSKIFGFNLAAGFLTSGVGGEAAINYLKGKEKLLSTILRQPVVLGLPGESVPAKCDKYTKACVPGGVKFGWIVGPIFQINNDRQDAEFLQKATVKTVAADVSVPSWWKSVDMHAEMSWISAGSLRETKGDSIPLSSSDNPIYLPAQNPDFAKVFRSSPRATIQVAKSTKKNPIVIDGNSKHTMIIEGKDIWRVNSVTLGNIKSSAIEILGDMDAIEVKFPAITTKACTSKLMKNDEKSTAECNTRIRLWSRHADTVDYGTHSKIFWSKAFPQEGLNLLAPTIVSMEPQGGLKLNSKNIPITVKLIGTGFSGLDPAKIVVTAGDSKIQGTAITLKTEHGGFNSLTFDVNPKDVWGESCQDFDTVQIGNIGCKYRVSMTYAKKSLKNVKAEGVIFRIAE